MTPALSDWRRAVGAESDFHDKDFFYHFAADTSLSSPTVSVLPTPSSINASDTSPRGLKRSRSPDIYGDLPASGDGDDGRSPPKMQSAVIGGRSSCRRRAVPVDRIDD